MSSDYDRQIGRDVAAEMHEDNPDLDLIQCASEVDWELFWMQEPPTTEAEFLGMQDYYATLERRSAA